MKRMRRMRRQKIKVWMQRELKENEEGGAKGEGEPGVKKGCRKGQRSARKEISKEQSKRLKKRMRKYKVEAIQNNLEGGFSSCTLLMS